MQEREPTLEQRLRLIVAGHESGAVDLRRQLRAMDNLEGIVGLAEVQARWARHRIQHADHHEAMQAFIDAGIQDAAEADALIKRTDEQRAERNQILAELRRIDPAFTAEMN